jgi:hypothetical protein
MNRLRRAAALAVACVALVAFGCGGDNSGEGKNAALPTGGEPVALDPADFTAAVDNRYWPMAPDGKPGRRWVLRSDDERIVVSVTGRKKSVAGIDALVLNDTARDDEGNLVEVTDDWYAQDREGNVWYLGAAAKEYEDGKVVSTDGSWQHGVDGAYAGVVIPADPRPGLKYRQEYYKGEAEDVSTVVRVNARVSVPAGAFGSCLETRDTTALEPDLVERKYYAPGVGPVMAAVTGESGRDELVSYRK